MNEEVEEKKKSPLLLFIIIAVLLVAASVGGTLFFVMGASGEDEAVEEVIETPEAIYFSLDPKFQTNYEVNGRQRLFQLAISLVTREQDVIDALAMHKPSVRGRLTILLHGQDFTALQTPEGRENLRGECLKVVQEVLEAEIGKPGVEKVLFTDFVVQ